MTDNSLKTVKTREKYGSIASVIGICVNVLLAAIKFVAGLLSGSIAIIADAVNNLSDAGSSAVTGISFKIAAKPADRDHPFGHARIEYIASLIVSFLILSVGLDFLVDSGKKIFGLAEIGEVSIGFLPIFILSVSIAMKLGLAIFFRIIGNKINSSVVKAASVDSFSDSISTAAVLAASLVVKYTGFVIIDAIVGVLVSVMILFAGIGILNETKNSLLGEAPVEETVKAINEIIAKYPEVIGIHDMLVHNYGPNHYFASFHAEVDGRDDIYLLHDVIDNIEKEIADSLNILCSIHLDPILKDDEETNKMREIAEGVIKKIDDKITTHDFRIVKGTTHTNLIFDIVLPFESKLSPKEITELICRGVSEVNPTYFCVITVDRG